MNIPDEIVKDLKKMAIDADKDLKTSFKTNYCQLVNKDLITVSELETTWNKLLEKKDLVVPRWVLKLYSFLFGEKKEQTKCQIEAIRK